MLGSGHSRQWPDSSSSALCGHYARRRPSRRPDRGVAHHSGQSFVALRAGRRFGKSSLAAALAVGVALLGGMAGLFAPITSSRARCLMSWRLRSRPSSRRPIDRSASCVWLAAAASTSGLSNAREPAAAGATLSRFLMRQRSASPICRRRGPLRSARRWRTPEARRSSRARHHDRAIDGPRGSGRSDRRLTGTRKRPRPPARWARGRQSRGR